MNAPQNYYELLYFLLQLELMEKIEKHINVISQMTVEIDTLTIQGQEKESQLKDSANKVKNIEGELQNLSTVKVGYCIVI